MANDKYILSNDYYVEIQKQGSAKLAILFNPAGSEVSQGIPSEDLSVVDLVNIVINRYIIAGREIDPSSWVNVPIIVREEKAPKPVLQKIKGRVVNSKNNKGLKGVAVSLGKVKTSTKQSGKYSLEVLIDDKPPIAIISFKFPKYEPKDVNCLKLDNTYKNSIEVVKLDTLEKSLEKETASSLVMEESDISKLNTTQKKTPEAVVTETVNKEVNKINERLLPFALKLLAEFGITSLAQTSKKTCPPLNQIPGLITRKNKLTRQLNNILKITSKVSTIASILGALVIAAKIVVKIIRSNPIPATIGGPGPIGVLFSIPQGIISVIEDKKQKISKLIDKFGNVVSILKPSTIPLVASLAKVLNLLSTTDVLIGECLDEARQSVVDEINRQTLEDSLVDSNPIIGDGRDGFGEDDSILNGGSGGVNSGLPNGVNAQSGQLTIGDIDFQSIDESRIRNILGLSPNANLNIVDLLSGTFLQVQLDEELTKINAETAEEGSPIVTEYNGFKLAVETQETETNLDIKRRFAVGKDSQGVTIVKGEPSFASSDQILINELIFTIDQNDLKPN